MGDRDDPALREAYLQDFFLVLALCNTVVVSGRSHIHSIHSGQWNTLHDMYIYIYVTFCLECSVSSVRIPPEAAHLIGNVTALGVLCCFAFLFV